MPADQGDEILGCELLPRPRREPRASTRKRISFDTTVKVQHRERKRNPTNSSSSAKAGKDSEDKESGAKRHDDDAENSGFSDWLRSADGMDTLRLFVVANSILVFVTIAWPHVQQGLAALRELYYGEDDDDDGY